MVATFTAMLTTDTLSAARAVLNDAIARLENNFADTSTPTNPVDGMLFFHSSNHTLQIYDLGNTAYRTIVPDITAAQGGVMHTTSAQTLAGTLTVNAATGDNHTPRAVQVEDAIQSVIINVGGFQTSDDKYLWSVPLASQYTIDEIYLICNTATTSSVVSTTDWEFQVRNLTAAEDLLSSPKLTSDTEITADARYALGVDQNNTKTDLASAGEVLELQVTKTGSPTDLQAAEIIVQIDYKVEPVLMTEEGKNKSVDLVLGSDTRFNLTAGLAVLLVTTFLAAVVAALDVKSNILSRLDMLAATDVALKEDVNEIKEILKANRADHDRLIALEARVKQLEGK